MRNIVRIVALFASTVLLLATERVQATVYGYYTLRQATKADIVARALRPTLTGPQRRQEDSPLPYPICPPGNGANTGYCTWPGYEMKSLASIVDTSDVVSRGILSVGLANRSRLAFPAPIPLQQPSYCAMCASFSPVIARLVLSTFHPLSMARTLLF
jgi:hypothetical protein